MQSAAEHKEAEARRSFSLLRFFSVAPLSTRSPYPSPTPSRFLVAPPAKERRARFAAAAGVVVVDVVVVVVVVVLPSVFFRFLFPSSLPLSLTLARALLPALTPTRSHPPCICLSRHNAVGRRGWLGGGKEKEAERKKGNAGARR